MAGLVVNATGQGRYAPAGLGGSPGMNRIGLSVCTGYVLRLQGAPFKHSPVG